ncbi:uncharacterized protein LOC136066385 [Quercus suber]|uniref:uncharacterized protein LOC136066385 n=1 Tax=Quercus suber TaxID=58331 RepID=UPI0032DE7D0E
MKKNGKNYQSPQGIVCYECNGHGHLKKECPNYLRGKGKVYATTLSDSDSSNSDSDENCDGKGNFSAFMTIAHMESLDDLSVLVEELGEHTELESIGIVEESNAEEDESAVGFQENYNSLLEKSGEYTRVAKVAVKKMKKADKDCRSLLLEVVQANAKAERVSSKKLDEVLAHQKPSSDKSRFGYTGESSLAVFVSKEVKFVKAKELMVATIKAEKVKPEKKRNVIDQRVLNKPRNQSVVKSKAEGKSLPKSQRGLRTNHFCHHCGLQGHTRPNCHKLRVLKNASDQRSRGPRNDKRNWVVE